MIRISSWYWSQVCVPNTQWGQTIPKHQESRAEKALFQGHTRRKDRQTWVPWKLSEKPFSRKAERVAWLLLVSEPLFLRSGHDVPVNRHQNKRYSQFWQQRFKAQGTTLYLWGPGPGQGEGSWAGWFSCPEGIHPAPSLGPLPVLNPGWGGRSQQAAALESSPQTPPNLHHWGSLVPGTQPGTFHLMVAFHLNWRESLVANINWVNSQFTTITLFERGPNHRGELEVMVCKIFALQP